MVASQLLTTFVIALGLHSAWALRVAVVNDIPGHFEVLAGVLGTLSQLDVDVDIYFVGNPNAPQSLGLIDWLRAESGGAVAGTWRSLQLRNSSDPVPEAPLLICVSAELAPQVCRGVVGLVKPRLLLLWVHRADAATAKSKILSLHSNYALLALAPHVATLASSRLKQPVGWALPLVPFHPAGPPCLAKACLRGFAIQGTVRKFKTRDSHGFTRNYAELWARLAQLKADAAPRGRPAVQVTVLGKGQREDLLVPDAISADVVFHSRLPYELFWGNISAAYALVPAFGMTVYTVSRISSTLLASLICGVPMIADREMLSAYSFLTEEHVFLREPGEDEAAAMVRIMHDVPEAQLFARRTALVALRERMHRRTIGIFEELIARV